MTEPSRRRRLAQRLRARVRRSADVASVTELAELGDRLARVEDHLRGVEAQVAEVAADRAALASSIGADGSDPEALGIALRDRLDHSLLHAEALAQASRRAFEDSLAEVRGTAHHAHAMAERARQHVADGGPTADASPSVARPDLARRFQNDVPGFEALYRTFEDRHRGSQEEITERQRSDYLSLIGELPRPDLPVVDLGCGRGELVALLGAHDIHAVGVDSNAGQLRTEHGTSELVEADLFDWLDECEDGSLRAVTALHVIEHLPVELQTRLVFEARRVLCADGLLVLETPNALSVTTAATNFWVDPSHERPVHPLFLEFLAREAGFRDLELRPLHPVGLALRGRDVAEDLVEDLDSLLFGNGDVALLARR